jgi:hypothetical protein
MNGIIKQMNNKNYRFIDQNKIKNKQNNLINKEEEENNLV